MEQICQSCGMLLTRELQGTNEDQTPSKDYCHYCLIDGRFTKDETMEEMIESCIPFRINDSDCPDADAARSKMKGYFPALARWKQM